MLILVLFNLKPSVDPDDYEVWARGTDLPTVRTLPSIGSFDVYQATGLLMGEGDPPYDYVELIKVTDDTRFGDDITTPKMQEIAAQFQKFADNPLFITLHDITAEA